MNRNRIIAALILGCALLSLSALAGDAGKHSGGNMRGPGGGGIGVILDSDLNR